MEMIEFPTKPVEEILGPSMLAAFHRIKSGDGCIVQRGSIRLSGPMEMASKLTDHRQLSQDQVERLRLVLITPRSYWIGAPIC